MSDETQPLYPEPCSGSDFDDWVSRDAERAQRLAQIEHGDEFARNQACLGWLSQSSKGGPQATRQIWNGVLDVPSLLLYRSGTAHGEVCPGTVLRWLLKWRGDGQPDPEAWLESCRQSPDQRLPVITRECLGFCSVELQRFGPWVSDGEFYPND